MLAILQHAQVIILRFLQDSIVLANWCVRNIAILSYYDVKGALRVAPASAMVSVEGAPRLSISAGTMLRAC